MYLQRCVHMYLYMHAHTCTKYKYHFIRSSIMSQAVIVNKSAFLTIELESIILS